MMAGWLLYTLLTSLLLVIAGFAMELMARAFRAPVRAVWLGVIVAAALLSAASLLHTTAEPPQPALAPSDAVLRHDVMPQARESQVQGASVTLSRTRAVLRIPLNDRVPRLDAITALRLDLSRWQRYDAQIAAICASLAVAGLLVVFGSCVRLRRMRHSLVASEIDGVSVLVSRNLGPAVFGVLRPRVVVPRWLLTFPADERRTIFLHEQQHFAARDPMLVLLGAVAVALQPWNALLWIAFARLRLAVEADCDARVLSLCHHDVRWYGALLIRVCEHESTPNARRLPLTAFVGSTSHLERRVRRMTSQPRVRSLSTLSAFVGAVLCAGVAFSIRILNAHEATAKASVAATSVIEWAAPASAGATAGSATYDSEPVVTPLWRMRLPGLVNSERAQLRPASVVVPAFGPRQPLIASVPRDTQKEVFAPETLLVSASNSLWPLHARVISTTTDGASHVVVVSDRLGQALPSADTLQVFGPIRLILPDARFRIRIESLGGDLYFRTSRLPSPDGNGQWLGEMLGRDFIASREVTGESVTFRFNGKGIMHGQRVP